MLLSLSSFFNIFNMTRIRGLLSTFNYVHTHITIVNNTLSLRQINKILTEEFLFLSNVASDRPLYLSFGYLTSGEGGPMIIMYTVMCNEVNKHYKSYKSD